MKETHNVVWEAFHNFYHNLFVRILRWPRLTLVIICIVMAAGLSLFPRLGGEFLPKLEEGNIWAHAIMPTTITLPQGAKLVSQMRAVFLSFPEVSRTLCLSLAAPTTARRPRVFSALSSRSI